MVSEIPLLSKMRAASVGPLHPRCPPIMSTPPNFRERRVLGQPVKDQHTPSPKLLKVKNDSPQMFRVRIHLKNVIKIY